MSFFCATDPAVLLSQMSDDDSSFDSDDSDDVPRLADIAKKIESNEMSVEKNAEFEKEEQFLARPAPKMEDILRQDVAARPSKRKASEAGSANSPSRGKRAVAGAARTTAVSKENTSTVPKFAKGARQKDECPPHVDAKWRLAWARESRNKSEREAQFTWCPVVLRDQAPLEQAKISSGMHAGQQWAETFESSHSGQFLAPWYQHLAPFIVSKEASAPDSHPTQFCVGDVVQILPQRLPEPVETSCPLNLAALPELHPPRDKTWSCGDEVEVWDAGIAEFCLATIVDEQDYVLPPGENHGHHCETIGCCPHQMPHYTVVVEGHGDLQFSVPLDLIRDRQGKPRDLEQWKRVRRQYVFAAGAKRRHRGSCA